ncbi:hypothetical protein WA158_006378 [Blastocystis sp. Blastoise]
MVKILLTGDVQGHVDILINKVNKINSAKGAFDVLFCVGQFFNQNDISCLQNYINGTEKWPMETYVVLGGDILEVEDIISLTKIEKLHFITRPERKSILGLDIVFVSGLLNNDIYSTDAKSMNYYTHSQIESLKKTIESQPVDGIDFLFSAEWGYGFYQNLTSEQYPSLRDVKSVGSSVISTLLNTFKPRYHIAAKENVYYERLPYKNDPHGYITRFIALCQITAVDDKSKKWIHALSVQPFTSNPTSLLEGVSIPATSSPFIVSPPLPVNTAIFNPIPGMIPAGMQMKRPIQNDYQSKRQGLTSSEIAELEQNNQSQGRTNFFLSPPIQQQNRDPHLTSQECWFCLASSSAAKHLIVSIGIHTYLALAKGPLTENHVLILPIQHVPSFNLLDDEGTKETQKFILAVRDYYRSIGKCFMMWERVITNFNVPRGYKGRNNVPKQNHTQYQCVPLDKDIKAKDVQLALNASGSTKGIRFNTLSASDDLKGLTENHDYLYVCVYTMSEEEPTRFLFIVKDQRPNMQFFRQTVTSLLEQQTDRSDWKNVQQTEEEERADCEKFKKSFKQFDFTDEE